MSEEYVSLNPETFSEGGGLINDVEGEWKEFRFEMKDLKGGSNLSPYLACNFVADGEEYELNWSCGGAAFWEPSGDGKSLKAKGSAKGINKGSNLGIFLASLYNAGFPKDKLGNDIQVLNGMVAHMIRVPAPERRGLSQPEPGRERTIPTVHKIVKLPWDKAKAKGKAGKAQEAVPELEETVAAIIMNALADNLEGVAKKDVIKLVVAKAKAEIRGAAMQMANDDTWLKSRTEWAYENGMIKMP